VISQTTKGFWKHFDALPQDVRRQAVRAYALWRSNPSHPSLQFKCVNEKKRGLFGPRWASLARIGIS
jgi:hypothetical protein